MVTMPIVYSNRESLSNFSEDNTLSILKVNKRYGPVLRELQLQTGAKRDYSKLEMTEELKMTDLR